MDNHITYEDSTLGAGGEGEAILVLSCIFLDTCYLVDLLGPMCPGADEVRVGGTTPGAIIFGITRGSSTLTQESEGKESNFIGLLLVYHPEDVPEDNSVYVDPLLGGQGIEQMRPFIKNNSDICSGQPSTEEASIPIACRGVRRVDSSRERSVQSRASTTNNQNIEYIQRLILFHKCLMQLRRKSLVEVFSEKVE
ncbi:hypothetical protein M9H77_07775 [Catharanthus roseus]|uniref:Uncharacterized protein n=1 Tax=Catharanthus roseus TaxID=4058 RepID=A0ACC0BVY2_CATRO|nr:hypothetical protein M9H77_07775 [Catharanthus roseus]